MEVKLVEIDPELAAELLNRRLPNQRRLRYQHVKKLAEDMKNGDWKLTGDTIKISIAGELMDGQHRLQAIRLANITLVMPIAFGVEEKSYEVLDQGLKRGFPDVLAHYGIENNTVVAASMAWLEHYILTRKFDRGGVRKSIPTLMKLWEENQEIMLYASMGKKVEKKFRFPAAGLTAAFYVFSITETEDVEYFAKTLTEGTNLQESDPIYTFREVLQDRLSLPANRRHGNSHYMVLLIRAWNAYARGNDLSKLFGVGKGGYPEVFDPNGLIDKKWPRK